MRSPNDTVDGLLQPAVQGELRQLGGDSLLVPTERTQLRAVGRDVDSWWCTLDIVLNFLFVNM